MKLRTQIFAGIAAAIILALSGCSGENNIAASAGKVMYLSAGGRVKTMDPALAADLASRHQNTGW